MLTCWPSHSIVPSLAGPTPEITLTSVDLPAPLSPTSATTWPGNTSISASVRACTAPKRFEIPLSDRTGVAGAGAGAQIPLPLHVGVGGGGGRPAPPPVPTAGRPSF